MTKYTAKLFIVAILVASPVLAIASHTDIHRLEELKDEVQSYKDALSTVLGRTGNGGRERAIKLLENEISAVGVQISSLEAKLKEKAGGGLGLSRSLSRGMSGDDVKALQEFLAQDKDVYPEGLATGYFGRLTESAVFRFQAKHGIDQVGVVGPKTRAKLNSLAAAGAVSATANCVNSTTRPCFDRVTPGKIIGLPAKAGENSLKACLQSKSPSLRGFAHTKTTLSELESYQYCFEGKSTAQIRFFAGATGSPIVPSPKPKLPKLACTQAPEFSTLGWLDPGAPWSISEPVPIIDSSSSPGPYTYFYSIETMLKTKSGTLFVAGVTSGYASDASFGFIPVMKKSTDNGASWNSIQLPDAPPNWGFVYSMIEDNNGVIYAGGTALWKSIDGGNTWKTVPMPYPDTYWGGFLPIYHMTLAKDNSLIATFVSAFYAPTKVSRSADGGNTWNELFSYTYLITPIIEAADGSLVFRDGVNVYRYFGGTITTTFTDYANLAEPNVGLLKAHDGALYLISVDTAADLTTVDYAEPGSAFLAAYKSTDNGITWIKLGTLPNSWSVQGSPIEAPDGTLYVSSYSTCDKKDAVYKSTDKGVTWSIIGASPTFGNINPDFWYYFKIRPMIEVSGKVLVGGNAPVIFSTK